MDFGFGYEEPISWWNSIITSPTPDALPIIARHLFSICPNSASCERGFSSLGWLTNKRRLQLGIEKLESMSKMITYWKSNAEKELGFYGKENKKNSKLSETELNRQVTEALADTDEMEDDEDEQIEEVQSIRRTVSGEIIPNNNVIVLIENIWIEKDVDLSNKLVLEDIGDIPEDFVDELLLDETNENQNDPLIVDEKDNDVIGRGVLDFNVDDLISEFEK